MAQTSLDVLRPGVVHEFESMAPPGAQHLSSFCPQIVRCPILQSDDVEVELERS
jgi:hypothetical protein